MNSNIPKSNPAFVLRAVEDVAFEDRPMPSSSDLGPLDALVAVKATGICGSDIHYWKHGRIGKYELTDKMILGHESSGVIAEVGSQVKGLKKGDKVALEPGESCGHCYYCKEGRYFLCEDMKFAATPPFDGTLASFYKLPAHLCYKLPDSLPFDEGAVIEPLAVAVHALTQVARIQPNMNVLVFGAGPVGLLVMATAKAMAARKVIAADINADRLAFAKSYAADSTFLPSPRQEGENDNVTHARRLSKDLLDQVQMETRGFNAIDLVVDCTGAEICIQTGIFAVKEGGTIAAVGMGKDEMTFPISTFLGRALEMRGSFRYGPGAFQLAVDLVAQKKVNVKPLITHTFSFKEAEAAYNALYEQKGPDGKPPIKAIIFGPEA